MLGTTNIIILIYYFIYVNIKKDQYPKNTDSRVAVDLVLVGTFDLLSLRVIEVARSDTCTPQLTQTTAFLFIGFQHSGQNISSSSFIKLLFCSTYLLLI